MEGPADCGDDGEDKASDGDQDGTTDDVLPHELGNIFSEVKKICSCIEHPSILNVIGEGIIPVDNNGIVNIDCIEDYLIENSTEKLLVSVTKFMTLKSTELSRSERCKLM